MTISSSLNASVSGLSSNASRLAGISDNIANSATNGYRRVETDFHSMVISNRQHAYAAGGVRSSQQRMIDQSRSLISTNNSTDLAVNGRGLLPVSDAAQIKVDNGRSPMKLTSTGSFRLDKDGYLSTTSGLTLLGWPAREDGSIPNYARDSSLDLEPIKINAQTLSGQPTTKMRVAVNLPATATMAGAAPSTEGISVEYFDNLGRPHSFEFTFTPVIPGADASNKWRMDITDSASQTALIGAYEMSFKDARNAGGTLNSITPLDSSPAYNASTGTVILNATIERFQRRRANLKRFFLNQGYHTVEITLTHTPEAKTLFSQSSHSIQAALAEDLSTKPQAVATTVALPFGPNDAAQRLTLSL